MDFRYLRTMKKQGRRLVMCTAYDAAFAEIMARSAEVDLLLVGDSLAMVVQGKETTREVTLDQMAYHTELAARGVHRGLRASYHDTEQEPAGGSAAAAAAGFAGQAADTANTGTNSATNSAANSSAANSGAGGSVEAGEERPGLPVIGDMPYRSYEQPEQALASARRLTTAGAHAVKIEGGNIEVVKALVGAGIPVMGHLGLLPQTAERFTVQGKGTDAAQRMKDEALALQEAGIFALVLECIPRKLAREISELLDIPTIGIGAGPSCDGQVLVLHDMLGLTEGYLPKFVKRFAELGSMAEEGIRSYAREVRDGSFPEDTHSYH